MSMWTILALTLVILSGVVSASPRRPCGCKPVFQFCANDYQTYSSTCEYNCKHRSTKFEDWFILYQGPCVSGKESTKERQESNKERQESNKERQESNKERQESNSLKQKSNKESNKEWQESNSVKQKSNKESNKEWQESNSVKQKSNRERQESTKEKQESNKNTQMPNKEKKESLKVSGYELEPRTGSCYKYHDTIGDWDDALSICVAEGGYLAIINSKTESTVLKQLFELNNCCHINAFIGFAAVIHPFTLRIHWVTISDEFLDKAGFDEWAPSDPTNGGRCGTITRAGLLDNHPCSGYQLPFICEKTPEKDHC